MTVLRTFQKRGPYQISSLSLLSSFCLLGILTYEQRIEDTAVFCRTAVREIADMSSEKVKMLCLRDFEEYAKEHLKSNTWDFYSQGAEREETLRENLWSYTRYRLIPRMLRSVPSRDLTATILGEQVSMPIGIAPSAFQRLAHPEGELAAAAAAAKMGVIYTLSTVATSSLEDVSAVVGGVSPLWMQVYVLKERKYTLEMIRKAEAKGYKALVVTVDTPVTGLQYRSWKNPLEFPPHIRFPNVTEVSETSPESQGAGHRFISQFEDTLTWDDVAAIISFSCLPVVLKGILTAEDALKASSMGAAGVWVSNHGGRQLDGVGAAVDALREISSALAGTGCEVYIDGGVRWGTDVFKCLALGARAVFIGRPALWGLAHSGKDGVRKILEILKAELDRAMHLAGCKDIRDIGPHLVKKRWHCRL